MIWNPARKIQLLLFAFLLVPATAFADSQALSREEIIEEALEQVSTNGQAHSQELMEEEESVDWAEEPEILLQEFEAPDQPFLEDDSDWMRFAGDKRFEIGYEYYNFIYEEPDVMRDEGFMQGLYAYYTYYGYFTPEFYGNDRYMFRLEARYADGEVDYENSGSMEDIDDYAFEVRGLVGSVFTNGNYAAIPYLGFGYRYLNDDSGGRITSTGYYGYERESEYYYIPAGVNLIADLDNGWFFETNLEFDIFCSGQQTSHLSDVDSGYNDLENDQNNGYGARASLRLRKDFGLIDIVIEPYIRYWNIKKSEDSNFTYSNVIIGYGYEPKNNTREYGLRGAIRF
ncbi:hypothetical protein ACFLZ3_02660 [Candidatus Omnitrophota bacterium]